MSKPNPTAMKPLGLEACTALDRAFADFCKHKSQRLTPAIDGWLH